MKIEARNKLSVTVGSEKFTEALDALESRCYTQLRPLADSFEHLPPAIIATCVAYNGHQKASDAKSNFEAGFAFYHDALQLQLRHPDQAVRIVQATAHDCVSTAHYFFASTAPEMELVRALDTAVTRLLALELTPAPAAPALTLG